MADSDRSEDRGGAKARREAARKMVGAYHQEQLRILVEHLRDGFAQLDVGEIDEFELDDLIHRYKRAAKNLWVFCEGTGGQFERAADALTYMRDRGDERDWWADSSRRLRRSSPPGPS